MTTRPAPAKIAPAYAKTFARYILQGSPPRIIAVVLAHKWSIADDLPKVCINPREWAADVYEFDFLRGLDVMLILGDEVGMLPAAECICELLEAGPHDLVIANEAREPVADGFYAAESTAFAWFDAVMLRDLQAEPGKGDETRILRRARQARLRAVREPAWWESETVAARLGRRGYLRQVLPRQNESATK